MSSDEPAPSLRDRQKEVTRDVVLNAVAKLMEDTDLNDLTFADVATAAGVSERTIYRHFPTRDDLLEEFWRRVQERLSSARNRQGAEAPVWEQPKATFPYLDRHERLIKGVIASPQAALARAKFSVARAETIRAAVLKETGPLPEPLMTHVCAAVQTLNAPVAWKAMKDDYGLTGEEAGEAASLAIKALIDAVKLKGRADD